MPLQACCTAGSSKSIRLARSVPVPVPVLALQHCTFAYCALAIQVEGRSTFGSPTPPADVYNARKPPRPKRRKVRVRLNQTSPRPPGPSALNISYFYADIFPRVPPRRVSKRSLQRTPVVGPQPNKEPGGPGKGAGLQRVSQISLVNGAFNHPSHY